MKKTKEKKKNYEEREKERRESLTKKCFYV